RRGHAAHSRREARHTARRCVSFAAMLRPRDALIHRGLSRPLSRGKAARMIHDSRPRVASRGRSILLIAGLLAAGCGQPQKPEPRSEAPAARPAEPPPAAAAAAPAPPAPAPAPATPPAAPALPRDL